MSVNQTTRDERVAAWAIQTMRGVPWLERVGRVRKAGSCTQAMADFPGADRRVESARESLSRVEQAGFRVLCWSEADYPRLLRAIVDPPLVLSVWGELRATDALAIAIVGSRTATRYGREMSHRLASELAQAGLTIISGLARGIDKQAHEGALDAGGRTIAVLGSGLLDVYPREHRKLAERIAARGAVISELPLDEPPRGQNFPRRNRIITGAALGTVVVEATLKSGSLVSARMALEQDREVFAVPGPALAPNSSGVHALIRDGATLVTRGEDIIEELRPELRELLARRPLSVGEAPAPRRRPSDPTETRLIETLKDAPEGLGLDHLVERARIPTPQALAALGRLEVKGVLWSLPGGVFQLKP